MRATIPDSHMILKGIRSSDNDVINPTQTHCMMKQGGMTTRPPVSSMQTPRVIVLSNVRVASVPVPYVCIDKGLLNH